MKSEEAETGDCSSVCPEKSDGFDKGGHVSMVGPVKTDGLISMVPPERTDELVSMVGPVKTEEKHLNRTLSLLTEHMRKRKVRKMHDCRVLSSQPKANKYLLEASG